MGLKSKVHQGYVFLLKALRGESVPDCSLLVSRGTCLSWLVTTSLRPLLSSTLTLTLLHPSFIKSLVIILG